jgi:pimeloyl-ACP methyl ester carboxylesterase
MLAVLVPGAAMADKAPDGPGTLISQTPMPKPPPGASAWFIRYRSLAENGVPVEITGFVVVPEGPAPKEGRNVVAWVHSTVGIAESCAPSKSPTRFSDIDGLPDMIKAGDVVVATDLQGLGTPGPQPYLVGISSGRAVLDSARAVRALAAANASDRVVLSGVSQGAHAALWAAQLAPRYAPDLRVLGVAAAAAPTDLIANFALIGNPFVRSLMTGYVSDTWSHIYAIPLSTFANPAGRFFIHQLAKVCLRLNPIVSASNTGLLLLSRSIPDHLGEPWTKPLRDNAAKPVRLSMPMLIAQGDKDGVVIPKVTRAYVAASCKAGNTLDFITAPDGTHTNIGARTVGATIDWIAARFARQPAPSSCDTLKSDTIARP